LYGRTAWKSTPRYQALSPLAKEAGWGSQVSRGAHNPEVGGSKGGTAARATSTITQGKARQGSLKGLRVEKLWRRGRDLNPGAPQGAVAIRG